MSFTIDGYEIEMNKSPFIVAEIGMNHNGETELGKKMIRRAGEAGADAVKFQSFRTNDFLSNDVGNRDDYRKYELTREDHEIFQEEANQCDLTFFSTPFDRSSVDMLEELGMPCFKVASSDLTNYPFLEYIAEKQKPMIVSTGYSSLDEVAKAVQTIQSTGNEKLVLLHCLSTYPASPEDMNLGTIFTMHRAFDCPVGLSDHSEGSMIPPVTATSLGASLIEKHFTIDHSLPGFDHEMSTEPDEFKKMVNNVRTTVKTVGDGEKKPNNAELEGREAARRSLYWTDSYSSGTTVNQDMIVEKRPGTGIAPKNQELFVGKKLSTKVHSDGQVQFSHFDW